MSSRTFEEEGSGQPRDAFWKGLTDCVKLALSTFTAVNVYTFTAVKMSAFEEGMLLLHLNIYNANISSNKCNILLLSPISSMTSA